MVQKAMAPEVWQAARRTHDLLKGEAGNQNFVGTSFSGGLSNPISLIFWGMYVWPLHCLATVADICWSDFCTAISYGY